MKWLGFVTIGLILVPFFINSRGNAVGSAPNRSPIVEHSPITYPMPKAGIQKAQLEQAQLQILIYQARMRNQGVTLKNQARTEAVAVAVSKK